MRFFTFFYLFCSFTFAFSQSRSKPLIRLFYDATNHPFSVIYKGGNRITVNSKNQDVVDFFNVLTMKRMGRKQLKHLLLTHAQVHFSISDRVGLYYKDNAYRVIAGLTGQAIGSGALIPEYYKPNWFLPTNHVFNEVQITLYKGSILYIGNQKMRLDSTNVYLYDATTFRSIDRFSMDTIKIEPFLLPDLLYKNLAELYYYCGIHEIEHTRPDNIFEQLKNSRKIEEKPFKIERKAFRKRKAFNKKLLRKISNGKLPAYLADQLVNK